jgi:hypothetical protein
MIMLLYLYRCKLFGRAWREVHQNVSEKLVGPYSSTLLKNPSAVDNYIMIALYMIHFGSVYCVFCCCFILIQR